MKIKTFTGGYDHNFAYLIIENNECVLIDPSVPAEEILTYIQENNLILKFIIIMHSHFDHVVDLEKYKVPLYGHSALKIKIDKKNRCIKLSNDLILAQKTNLCLFFCDGDLLHLGAMQLKVIHTPGHTQDAICIQIENNLFTSDTLFVGCCGRTDLAGGNREQLKESLNKLKQLPDSTIIYPGHDYGSTKTSTIGKEKKNNPYFQQTI